MSARTPNQPHTFDKSTTIEVHDSNQDVDIEKILQSFCILKLRNVTRFILKKKSSAIVLCIHFYSIYKIQKY